MMIFNDKLMIEYYMTSVRRELTSAIAKYTLLNFAYSEKARWPYTWVYLSIEILKSFLIISKNFYIFVMYSIIYEKPPKN